MKYDEAIQGIKNSNIELAIVTAADLYLEKGIEAVKMTDIAEKAQLGVASLYRYFKTKHSLTIKAGIHIWENTLDQLKDIFTCPEYAQESGLEQVQRLVCVFRRLVLQHRNFLRFVLEFDAFVIREGIPAEDLKEYERSILSIMPIMEEAIKKGRADGTIRHDFDAELYYLTLAHTLMSLCQKLGKGEIIGSDDSDIALKELELAAQIFVDFIRA